MNKIITLGIDLAKNVFALHGIDANGKVVLNRPNVRRDQLLSTIAQLPPCLIGMEACGGAHYWAREFIQFGHTPKLMAPKFVAPYRMSGKSGKNDARDAAAICEAVTRPSMRFVPVKTPDDQAILALHRVRQGFVEERTALVNRTRGLLMEFGIVLPQRVDSIRHDVGQHLESLPGYANRAIGDLLSHLLILDERVDQYDKLIEEVSKKDDRAKRIMDIPGIGPITATALIAAIGNGHEFKNGRQLSAWLGMVPRQYSSGGKPKLGRITKKGDPYLRTLMILGARSVIQTAKNKTDRFSQWVNQLYQRVGYGKALVAIAAKNARAVWAILSKQQKFNPDAWKNHPMTSQQTSDFNV